MTPNRITAATVTAAGAVTPDTGLDISAAAKDYMLSLQINELKAVSGVPRARIAIEDTVDAFTTPLLVAMVDIGGPIKPGSPCNFSWRSNEVPSLRVGTADAKLRVTVLALSGTTPSLTLEAYLHK
jgi:hypothetical protein